MLDSILEILRGAFRIVFLNSSSIFFIAMESSTSVAFTFALPLPAVPLDFGVIFPVPKSEAALAIKDEEEAEEVIAFEGFLGPESSRLLAALAVWRAAIFALAAEVLVAYFCVPSSLESIGSSQSDSLNPLSWQSTIPPLRCNV